MSCEGVEGEDDLVVCLENSGGSVTIFTDHLDHVNAFNRALLSCSRDFLRTSPHADLWDRFWLAFDHLHDGRVTLHWVRSHQGWEELQAGLISAAVFFGNSVAYAMASRAANLNSPTPAAKKWLAQKDECLM